LQLISKRKFTPNRMKSREGTKKYTEGCQVLLRQTLWCLPGPASEEVVHQKNIAQFSMEATQSSSKRPPPYSLTPSRSFQQGLQQGCVCTVGGRGGFIWSQGNSSETHHQHWQGLSNELPSLEFISHGKCSWYMYRM
jgi:hypothetical protein